MSNYTKHKTSIMPKITQNVRLNNRKSYTRNEANHYKSNIPDTLDNEKKPGSSIDRKKPIYIFPKISSTKVPPGTANAMTSSLPPSYKINNLKLKKSMRDETDKDEYIGNNNIKISNPVEQIEMNINNDLNKEKKLVNNKIVVNINNYKDISINFLTN